LVSLEEAVIARFKTHGEHYEVLVDADLALDFKRNVEIDFSQVLAAENIFKDSKKGEKASEEHMQEIFGTSDLIEIARKIIKKGEIQFTTEQRKKTLEGKRKMIVTTIAQNSINPQTGTPHPLRRIERALEETKFKVEIMKTVEEQIPKAVKSIRHLLPLRFETHVVAAKIPGQYASKSHTAIKGFGEIKKDEWQNDGALIVVIELPAGIVEEFSNKLNSLTKGEVEIKIIKKD